MLKKISNIISVTCILCTVLTLFLSLFIKMAGFIGTPALTVNQYLMILGISFLIALCSLVFEIKGLPGAVLYIIHYLLCTTGFVVMFVLFGKFGNAASMKPFFGAVLFTAAYVFCLVIYLIIKRFLPKSKEAGKQKGKEEYTSIFKK